MFTYIHSFVRNRLESISRYPGAYMVALATAITAMIFNHHISGTGPYELENTLMSLVVTGLFTFPLMVAWPLMRQIQEWFPKTYEIIWQIAAIILWLLFYFCLPKDFENAVGSQQLWVVLSMFVAWFAPVIGIVYASRSNPELIWGWAQQFIIKAIIAGLSTVIVWGGIAASLASIESLFSVVIDSQVYIDVWIWVLAIVGVSVWLINLRDNEDDRDYLKIFRFFWLYIFLPLACLYALILLTYGIKILLTGVWPEWIVAWMVIGYTAFGLVGYLLTYPLREELIRVRRAHKAYFISLLLVAFLLFASIYIRIDQYGLTSHRYLVVMTGIWILIISWISLIKPRISLSTIVIAFMVCVLWSAYAGPFSAINLPTSTQYKTLTTLLQDNNFLKDGYIAARTKRIVISDTNILSWDFKSIYGIASYLGQEEGPEIFESLYAWTGFDQLSWVSSREIWQKFMASLGVDNAYADAVWQYPEADAGISYYVNNFNQVLDISTYAYIVPIGLEYSPLPMTGINISYSGKDKSIIAISINNKTTTIDLYEHIEHIRQSSSMPYESLKTKPSIEINGSDYKLMITQFSADKVGDSYKIYSFAWYVLLK